MIIMIVLTITFLLINVVIVLTTSKIRNINSIKNNNKHNDQKNKESNQYQ